MCSIRKPSHSRRISAGFAVASNAFQIGFCPARRIDSRMTKRVATYARTSTADNQTTENQIRELQAVAGRRLDRCRRLR
jgi:hypothetical protein